jgi:type II secretory pathway pseudopilin PulG
MNSRCKQLCKPGNGGFTLVELMVAIALAFVVLLLMIQLFSGTKQSYLFQEGLMRVQEDGRVAIELIARDVRKAGFRVPVWNEPKAGYSPLTAGSLEGGNDSNDTLQFMYQDSLDCTGVLNTAIDPETSEPAALYKRMTISVDGNQDLRWTCEYGDSPASFVTQFSNQTIIGDVESFQILYGVDTDFPPDFSINTWTTANNITPQNSVCLQSQNLCETGNLLNTIQDGIPLALRIALLIASPEPADHEKDEQSFEVLNTTVAAADDHKLRKLFTSTITLRNVTL